MTSRTLRLLPSGQTVPLPRRIESEPMEVHEARIAAIKRLGVKWLRHPAYRYDPQTYGPARAAFLACIAKTAAADRARNPSYLRQVAVNKALEQA
jgi:hypothetical protein